MGGTCYLSCILRIMRNLLRRTLPYHLSSMILPFLSSTLSVYECAHWCRPIHVLDADWLGNVRRSYARSWRCTIDEYGGDRCKPSREKEVSNRDAFPY